MQMKLKCSIQTNDSKKRNTHTIFKQTNSSTYQFIQIKNTFFNFVIGFSPLINLSKILIFIIIITSKPTKAFMNSRYCVVYQLIFL